MPEKSDKGSSVKTLTVFEVILRKGPIKPAEICHECGLNRSAVHRAIHVLIEQGWVRSLLGDRSCVATYKFDKLAVDAVYSQPIQDQIYPLLKELCNAHYLHGDIAFLLGANQVKLVESTDSKAKINSDLSLVTTDIATAIFSIMEPEQITRITSRALNAVSKDETDEITSGRLAARILQARRDGNLAWSTDFSILSIPFRDSEQLFGAVRLRQKTATSTGKQILTYVGSELQRSLPDIFQ
ncbi:MAG: hypothetical protein COB84_09085 [Rhodobacteraceae bacterium]|nr:MAG: hypothetical protein COB84_09085 [Paracoccaceae bacterium]